MSENKAPTRRTAIALRIVCIVLTASLVALVAYYGITIKDREQIINLTKSTVWVNNQTISQLEDSWTNWTFTADYAGYVSVQVYNSTTLSPSAKVAYNHDGINYNLQQEGMNMTLPILPANITISVGNSPRHITVYDPKTRLPVVLIVNQTVTITYHY